MSRKRKIKKWDESGFPWKNQQDLVHDQRLVMEEKGIIQTDKMTLK